MLEFFNQLLLHLPAILMALAAVIAALRNGRKVDENTRITQAGIAINKAVSAQAVNTARDAKVAAEKTAETTDHLVTHINGRMDELLEAARQAAFAAGQAAQEARHMNEQPPPVHQPKEGDQRGKFPPPLSNPN